MNLLLNRIPGAGDWVLDTEYQTPVTNQKKGKPRLKQTLKGFPSATMKTSSEIYKIFFNPTSLQILFL